MDLSDCRKKLDEIDKKIAELFEERMDVCEDVAAYKISNNRPVFDRQREREKLETLCALASDDLRRMGIKELFTQLMSISRKLQYNKLTQSGLKTNLPFIAVDDINRDNIRVCYQGVEGAYSEKAVKKFFGDDIKRFNVPTFRDAMNIIADGAADYAVLPIENSSAGIVSQNYDMLAEFENYIVAQVTVKIEHCLLGIKGAQAEDIKRVYSHKQGLLQCSVFLDNNRHMMPLEMDNTAMAAMKVASDGEKSQAAIASRESAYLYGLDIIAENINKSDENYTRFIVVTNQRIFKKDADKISISFLLPHESGPLYRLMSHFIYNGLNMTKIESRPLPGRKWEYCFFVDFEGNLAQSSVKNAIRGIREESMNLRILGNY